jgi:autotransporter translocation and assembly factor TamB
MKNSILLVFATLIFGGVFQAFTYDSMTISDKIITKEYDFKNFTGLDASNDFKVHIRFSDKEDKVAIEVDEWLSKHVFVEMENGTLKIGLKDNVNIRGKETLNAYITTAKIDDFKASGDVEIYLENELVEEEVSIKLSGDSKLEGDMKTSKMNAHLRGDSYLNLRGSTDDLDIYLRGDSRIERYGFKVENLNIELRGDSEAYLSVNGNLNIKASGDSNFYYKGSATIVKKRLSGDSSLIKKG